MEKIKITNKLQNAVPIPADLNYEHFFQQEPNWINIPYKKFFADFFLPLEIMKFPINVTGKKPASTPKPNNANTLETEENANNIRLNSMADVTSLLDNGRVPGQLASSPPTPPQLVCCSEVAEINNNHLPQSLCGDAVDDKDAQDKLKDVCSTVLNQRPRSDSQFDDSGFNSSASDDKEEFLEAYYDCDDIVEDEEESRLRTIAHPRKTQSDSQLVLSSLEEPTTPSVKPTLSSDNLLLPSTRRHLPAPLPLSTDTIRSNFSETHPVVRDAHRVPRRTHHRRRRARSDLNNNDVPVKPLYTRFGRSDTHIQDFFQKSGILTLVACIMYTIFISVVFGTMGSMISTLKLVVGKDDLADLKDHLQTRRVRRQRPVMTSTR